LLFVLIRFTVMSKRDNIKGVSSSTCSHCGQVTMLWPWTTYLYIILQQNLPKQLWYVCSMYIYISRHVHAHVALAPLHPHKTIPDLPYAPGRSDVTLPMRMCLCSYSESVTVIIRVDPSILAQEYVAIERRYSTLDEFRQHWPLMCCVRLVVDSSFLLMIREIRRSWSKDVARYKIRSKFQMFSFV
jgi:hypothetical protein